MFSVDFKLQLRSRLLLERYPSAARRGLLTGVRRSMLLAEKTAKQTFGKPDQLKTLTGTLRSSINTSVRRQGNKVIGAIGSDIIYSRIHELGGNAGPSRLVYLRARPYITPSIVKNLDKMFDIIYNSINREVRNL